MLSSILATILFAQASGPEVNASQFKQLVQGLQSEIRDVSFLFEGGIRYIGSRRSIKFHPEEIETNYQGTYAYRSDGAELLDNYTRVNTIKNSFKHNTYFMLGRKYQFIERQLDQARSHVMEYEPVVGALNRMGSPERILYLYYFRDVEPASMNYQFLGWEEVDGHRCLKIQLDEIKFVAVAERPILRFWIDMERGGHPLRVDSLRGEHLQGRIEKIRLAQVPTQDGKQVWLPVSGEDFSFLGEIGTYLDAPSFCETYSLVDGTIQVNRGIPDSQFSLNWKGGMPETETLKKLRTEFGPTPLFRNDATSVQQRLDKKLAEADRQADRLDASAIGRSAWSTATILQSLVAGFGVVMLVGAIVLKRRAG